MIALDNAKMVLVAVTGILEYDPEGMYEKSYEPQSGMFGADHQLCHLPFFGRERQNFSYALLASLCLLHIWEQVRSSGHPIPVPFSWTILVFIVI